MLNPRVLPAAAWQPRNQPLFTLQSDCSPYSKTSSPRGTQDAAQLELRWFKLLVASSYYYQSISIVSVDFETVTKLESGNSNSLVGKREMNVNVMGEGVEMAKITHEILSVSILCGLGCLAPCLKLLSCRGVVQCWSTIRMLCGLRSTHVTA